MIDTCYHTQPHSASHGFWDSNSNAHSCTASIRPSFMCLAPTLDRRIQSQESQERQAWTPLITGLRQVISASISSHQMELPQQLLPSVGMEGQRRLKTALSKRFQEALRRPCCYYHPSFSPADRTLGRISRGQTQKFLELLPNRVTWASVGSGYSEKPHLVQVGKPGMKPGSGL